MSSALSPETWPFDIQWLPQAAYLVGGAVRDSLLARPLTYLDLDFVILGDAVNVARQIARHYQAGFVLLDAERQIARVVFSQATVDFAASEGDNLETDLRRRDFTVNAIAYNPLTKALIDPHNGQSDLQQSLIRMIASANLQDDPLRLLRGYRQAAQLGFSIEAKTQACLREFAPLLRQVAVERIRTELAYLLNTPGGVERVQQAWQDGLLSPWFPTANQRFEVLSQLDLAAQQLGEYYPALRDELNQWLRTTLKMSLLGLAKLACLVNPDPSLAEVELLSLKASKVELQSVTTLLQALAEIQQIQPSNLSLRQQYFVFKKVGNLFPALVVLAIASKIPLDCLSPLINRYLNPNDPVAHPQPLLTGHDLMKALNLPPSPKIGELLLEIQLAQIEGSIMTVEEAIQWAKNLHSGAENR